MYTFLWPGVWWLYSIPLVKLLKQMNFVEIIFNIVSNQFENAQT